MANQIRPDQIDQISTDVLMITWNNGKKCIYRTRVLRDNCPCALCREEREDKNPLKVLKNNRSLVELKSWRWIGNYAIGLEWTDAHDSGIYTYDFLFGLGEE
jgi:ATP-binding protein involved in chromosome partitioning